MRYVFSGLALATIMIASVHAQKNLPELFWATPDYAPFWIHDGTYAGRGIADLVYVQLKSTLSEYRHQELRSNISHMVAEMRRGKPLCGLLHHTRERAEFLAYSEPVAFLPSYQLFVRNEDVEGFRAKSGWRQGPIDLEKLLEKDTGLHLGLVSHHYYSDEHDIVLEKYSHRIKNIAAIQAVMN